MGRLTNGARPQSGFAKFGHAIAIADKSTPGSDDPVVDRRRVAAHVSGLVVIGLLNDIDIHRVRLRQGVGGVWVGQVDWRHPVLSRPPPALPRRLRRRAYHQLLNAYLGGRGAEMLEGFGWSDDGARLDYAAPETETAIALAELMSPHDPWRVLSGSLNFIGTFILDPVITKSICRLAEVISVERDLDGEHATWFVAGAMSAAR